MKRKPEDTTRNPSRPPSKNANPEKWLKRYREISSLVESGLNLAEIARELKLTRERVRQLAKKMGLKTARWHHIQRQRREPTHRDLRKIRALYQKGVGKERIALELDMHYPWVSSIIAKYRILRKYRCVRCGREFRVKGAMRKYCEACSMQVTREQACTYNKRRYSTDPEFRKRKLMSSQNWKRSESGKKWYAEYLKKLRRQRSAK